MTFMSAVVAAFNQEKALVGAFSVIVQLHRLIDLRHYLRVVLGGHHPVQVVPGVLGPAAGVGAGLELAVVKQEHEGAARLVSLVPAVRDEVTALLLGVALARPARRALNRIQEAAECWSE